MDDFIILLEGMENFIKNPLDFIYENLEETTNESIKKALALILKHNKKILFEQIKENTEQQEVIDKASLPKLEEKLISEPETTISSKVKPKKDVSDKAETLFYTLDEKEFRAFMSNISLEEKNYIKLEILKKIIEFKLRIKEQIVFNPCGDISKIQEELLRARQVLTMLNQEETIEETLEVKENTKILVLPNKKNNTYLYDDISDNIENAKEIKNTIDKIIDGYFLKTKDTKPIAGKTEKLFEYKHPNGIRILYIVLPNDYVVITGLFYKDKDKSTKIEAYYDESINRYLHFKDYIINNIENPDFYIEQAELIGNIYDLFEKVNKKEKGE